MGDIFVSFQFTFHKFLNFCIFIIAFKEFTLDLYNRGWNIYRTGKKEIKPFIFKYPMKFSTHFQESLSFGYQTIAFVLSFFRSVVSKSKQIDSLKNEQDDPKFPMKS